MEWPSRSHEDYAVTHPLRPLVRSSALTLCLFTLVCALIYAGLRDNRAAQNPIVIACIGAFTISWLAATLAMALRQPSAEETVRVWSWIAVAIILGADLSAIGVIWGAMPHASATAQMMIALFVMTCVPSQIIYSPENVLAIRGGLIALFGSLTLFLITPGESGELIIWR